MKQIIRVNLLVLGAIFFSGMNILQSQGFIYFENQMAANNHVVGFDVQQDFATNALTSGFVLNFFKGKFISEDDKNKCISNFENHEILAGEQFKIGFNYLTRLGKSSNYLFIEAGEKIFYESRMHEDIFTLIFKGNKVFENKNAILTPFQIRSFDYLFIKAGFHKYSEKYTLKLNLGYTGGQRLLDLKTTQGSLFTAAEGRYFDLMLDLHSKDVNPGSKSLFNISGHGLISDLSFIYRINKNIEIGASIEGLGYINWNKNLTDRSVDTSYHFEGAEISNILDSFSIAIKNVEELKSSFIVERKENEYKTNLPFIATIQYSQFIIPERFQIQLKYGWINSDLSKTLFISSLNYYLSPTALIGLNINAGGYGKFNIGGQIAACFSGKSSFHLYFNSISNLILPSNEMNFTTGLSYCRAL
jgi:hypothetical protein